MLSIIGISTSDLHPLIDVNAPDCVERIVPTGQMLSRRHHWDGLDLMESLS